MSCFVTASCPCSCRATHLQDESCAPDRGSYKSPLHVREGHATRHGHETVKERLLAERCDVDLSGQGRDHVNACPQWVATWNGVDRSVSGIACFSVAGTSYVSATSVYATSLLWDTLRRPSLEIDDFPNSVRGHEKDSI
jgi:hypothetical protein